MFNFHLYSAPTKIFQRQKFLNLWYIQPRRAACENVRDKPGVAVDCSVRSVAAMLAAYRGFAAVLTVTSGTGEGCEETPGDCLQDEWLWMRHTNILVELCIVTHMYTHTCILCLTVRWVTGTRYTHVYTTAPQILKTPINSFFSCPHLSCLFSSLCFLFVSLSIPSSLSFSSLYPPLPPFSFSISSHLSHSLPLSLPSFSSPSFSLSLSPPPPPLLSLIPYSFNSPFFSLSFSPSLSPSPPCCGCPAATTGGGWDGAGCWLAGWLGGWLGGCWDGAGCWLGGCWDGAGCWLGGCWDGAGCWLGGCWLTAGAGWLCGWLTAGWLGGCVGGGTWAGNGCSSPPPPPPLPPAAGAGCSNTFSGIPCAHSWHTTSLLECINSLLGCILVVYWSVSIVY